MPANNTIVFVELRHADGTVERIAGPDATTLWHGVIRAMNVAEAYGYPYSGPKFRVVPPPPPAEGESSPALQEGQSS